MDVDLTIRYSDERLCEIVASRPDIALPLYREPVGPKKTCAQMLPLTISGRCRSTCCRSAPARDSGRMPTGQPVAAAEQFLPVGAGGITALVRAAFLQDR